MNQDLSNRTVFILVILTLLISTIGTLTVVQGAEPANEVEPLPIGESISSSGQIRLELLPVEKTTTVTLEN